MFNKGFLLIEIGCEELPINKLKYINVNFKKYFKYQLKKYNFLFDKIKVFVSIRRISCLVKNLSFYQNFKNKYKIIKGPKIKISKNYIFVNKNLINWSNKIGLSIKKIKYIKKNSIKNFYFKRKNKINSIEKLISIILKNTFLYILKNNKSMSWGKGKYYFFRPIINIVIMFNKKIFYTKIFGIISNNIILCNKFIYNKNIFLNDSKKYIYNLLNYCKVIINFKDRKKKIINILYKISFKKNIYFIYKISYLDKIVSMIEWPFGILCNFDSSFLFLPKELIIFVIEKRFGFVSFNKKKELMNKFVIIIDMETNNDNKIKYGYKNVIESELNEIKYLFLKDRELYLISYLHKLKNIIFHKKIGNFLDKIKRILFLSKNILIYLNNFNINENYLYYIILLIKCDLATNLCKYYNNFKGIIGMYYALLEGKSIKTSLIIKNHYNITNNNDIYSSLIFLIDKIDDLIGIFILYNFKLLKCKNDPYGIRKLSFLIIKIILNKKFYINFYNILKFYIFLFKNKYNLKKYNILIILSFLNKRFWNYLLKLKYSKKIIFSFLKCNNKFNFLDIKNRIDTIMIYYNNKIFNIFINVYKRINNFLIKNKNDNLFFFNINFLIEKEEIVLYKYILFLKKKYKVFFLNHNYVKLMKYFFVSIKKINIFLNNIKINVDNNNFKLNRLYLLNKLCCIFNKFCDFSFFY